MQTCWINSTACKPDRCNTMFRQLTPHTMWSLKLRYAPKFIQINLSNAELNPTYLLALLAHHILHISRISVNTSLWLVDCTFAIFNENCEVQTSKDVKRPHMSSTPNAVQTANAEGELAKPYFCIVRSHCKWLLLHNSALMRLVTPIFELTQ